MNTRTDDKIRAAREYYETHDASEEIANADLTPHDPSESSALAGYSVRLPVEVLNQARTLAKEQGVTTGAWLREAIENAVVARSTTTEAVPVTALLGLIQQHTKTAEQVDPASSGWARRTTTRHGGRSTTAPGSSKSTGAMARNAKTGVWTTKGAGSGVVVKKSGAPVKKKAGRRA